VDSARHRLTVTARLISHEPRRLRQEDLKEGSIVSEKPITYSTLVVYFDPEFGEEPLPPLAVQAQRYDRQRALITAGGVRLLHNAFLQRHDSGGAFTYEEWVSAIGSIESVNWFVSADESGLIQYTAESGLIDAIAVCALEAYSVVTRSDYGPERPPFYVA
jgi:hypothetical protein